MLKGVAYACFSALPVAVKLTVGCLTGQCVEDVLQFVQDFTVHIEGVGHVCR
jgi:hypothetical protein